MPDRSSQRRDRLAAIGVGGKGQVPSAFDLGALPCAALVQEPRDQERLENQRANRGQNRDLVFIPQASGDETARRCQAATDSRGCPTAATRANRTSVDPPIVAVL